MQIILTPEILCEAYRMGIFPMAQSAQSQYVHWVCPDMRGQLSITGIHIPHSLKKQVRQQKIAGIPYEIKINHDFRTVIMACAQKTGTRAETWINDQIIKAYCALHEQGYAHSVECWQEGELAGGLYGVDIGGAFFGESMFSIRPNTSKVALIHLVARLWCGGYTLLDTQFRNDHLEQFGVYEIPYEKYMRNLQEALKYNGNFFCDGKSEKEIITGYLEKRKTL